MSHPPPTFVMPPDLTDAAYVRFSPERDKIDRAPNGNLIGIWVSRATMLEVFNLREVPPSMAIVLRSSLKDDQNRGIPSIV